MLTLLWALPAAAALAVAALGRRAAWLGPLCAAIALGLAVSLWSQAGGLSASAAWVPASFAPAVAYRLGLSGLSLVLVVLTLLLTALSGLAGLRHGAGFVAWLTLLGAAATGMFLARDFVLFYVFWELMLVPAYFLLVGWGGPGRKQAAWKFLIYNVGGSVALLLAIAALVVFGVTMPGVGVAISSPSAAIGGALSLAATPSGIAIPSASAGPIALALLIAFAIKTPIWPVHGWVADTYAELPAPAAALVSGVQSKAGLYGMLAILLPLMPGTVQAWAPVLIALGIVSVLYGALVALTAKDARRLMAYSSISHLGLVFAAFATMSGTAISGGIVQIVAHGLFSAALFLLIGMLETRLGGPVRVQELGGLARRAPAMAGAVILLAMAALGLPGLAGFPGELLMMIGIYHYSLWVAILAAIGLVIAAAYMLRLIQLVLHGRPSGAGATATATDLQPRDRWLLAPLALLVLLIGLYPRPIPQQASAAVTAVAAAATTNGGAAR